MIRRADFTWADANGTPEPGVYITVKTATGALATLFNDNGSSLSNPFQSGTLGAFVYNVTTEGVYTEEYRLSLSDSPRKVLEIDLSLSGLDGLFVNASSLIVPVGTDMVATTGYSALGVGGANYVADTAVDAAYIAAHPLTSFISANSRGFRLDLEQDLTPQMAGGKNDLTVIGVGTDNSPAINALITAHTAQAKCARIYFPAGALAYRCASTIISFYGVKFVGDGWHENPGTVGVTVYSSPQNFRGSILAFDANVKGMEFWDYTDNLANATAFEFEGSRYSIIEDLMLIGGGGTTVTAHGVQTHTILTLRNVRVTGFGGNGVHIVANTAGALTYGNSDGSYFSNVLIDANGCHGAYVGGNEANILTWIACKFRNNGGAGYIDFTTVGCNQLYGCQFATNNQSWGAGTAQTTQVQSDSALLATQANGSIILSNGSNTPHVLCGIYIESGTGRKAHVPSGTLILGGFLGQIGSAALEATSAPALLDGTGTLQALAVKSVGDLTLSHGSGAHAYVVNDAGGTAIVELRPGSGSFSEIRLTGNSNAISAGLDTLAGGGAGYQSADTFVHRNAAQTTTFNTADSSGFNINTGVLKVAGTQVVGARGAAVADATDAASAITQLNALLARARSHGLIA